MASSSSSSSLRTFRALLHRASTHGVSSLSRTTSSAPLDRIAFLGRKASLPVPFGTSASRRARRICTSTPLCMGRRACKIADRKGAQNAKKMKRNSKIGKEIVSAIKKGGPNPSSNTILAAVLEKAKQLDVPKDIVDRNLKKALEKSQEAYIEKTYGVYGFGGVSIVVEVLTDKITRSVQYIRQVVKDCGAKMADSGSVMFKFRHAQVVNIKLNEEDKDKLLSIALDSGAEDVIEPTVYEDGAEVDISESYYKVVCTQDSYPVVMSKLQEEGFNIDPDSGFELLPLNRIEVDDEAMELNKELMDKLLDIDDVDAVYSDQK